ncbi:MAG TPA: pyrroline-5-carboxylate reductase [Elainellaceae cyanobacterium]
MSKQLGIIGGGVMGEALLSRLVDREIYPPEQIVVSDPQSTRRDYLNQSYGVDVTSENAAIILDSKAVLLAIKPQIFDRVIANLRTAIANREPSDRSNQVVLSILAGMPLNRLESAFPNQPVVRAMPNTPATIGVGMTAIAPGQYATESHLKLAKQIFEAVGAVVEVPEYQMDAVTGLSGSGPGYIAVAIEALIDGGVAAGLPRAIATQLAIQTVRGTAELLQTSGLHPAELKDRVTSPGGTTIAGIASLEQSGFRSALIEAVKTACQRSQELGS